MTDHPLDVTGVVLAGGQSRRFEAGDKALATLGDDPLLKRVVGTLRAVTGRPPIVAVRTPEQQARLSTVLPTAWDVRFVQDAESLSGPVAGVTAACAEAETPWLFVAGCDMPLLEPRAISALFDKAAQDSARTASAIVPRSEGGYHEPLHALYRCSAVRNIASALSTGDGFGVLLKQLADVDYVPFADLPRAVRTSVTNVNTCRELERIAAPCEANQ
ncbi:molybdenum cofactor guanylyltransferase [Haloferax mediterranei ATCC 33500]|uniref:Probable molybdenum cofactor guanylyltransferase n=1 Tax=Haloferax mediterranei (strain ATCC 33500 / DSM 1411 / JCM 8866 / NBRC 14739 / NCIMB 2177 / R-4) TaxID=523841 RepID=I3R6P4_HALMT|nr:molybdenum cofactor guanylyltransferase [Haloferax mediterranei]AFK19904.1 molybdopterin-guanine dinucleotide biosynthesis protein A [Haloferax mediterranei ATCC 33500]AHZ23283.1 molybdopterin-guanine dinucleotide biosynthesis protein MobA [Haloferax mediterranei ATCC 33500]ELZ99448.1 molybdopterin-guanine dinucleotide biosynthesis protein MobA [Haloferax mediterranei ATCC 33500]MDX5987347.1 molybdenum cofactor guanylyltransferase [Haloferax mediterranei ATCC 33500]QCQ73859.1 molybdenum cof